MIKNPPCKRGTWVQSLVRELRYHMSQSNQALVLNYWACAPTIEHTCRNQRSHMTELRPRAARLIINIFKKLSWLKENESCLRRLTRVVPHFSSKGGNLLCVRNTPGFKHEFLKAHFYNLIGYLPFQSKATLKDPWPYGRCSCAKWILLSWG